MATIAARWGASVTADLVSTPSQDHAASAIVECEAAFAEYDAYLGKPSEAELLAETGGAGGAPFEGFLGFPEDDSTNEVIFLAELQGNEHESFVIPYVIDNAGGKPSRLLTSSIEGLPEDAEILFRFHAADAAYRISESLSKGWADSTAAEDAVFVLERKRGGVSLTVATVTFKVGENSPLIEVTDTSVAVGDRLIFHAPTLQDASLSDLVVTFVLIFV